MPKTTDRYSIYINNDGEYWLEETGVAVTGILSDILSLKDLKRFVGSVNALYKILDEIPENPKLPLVLKIKELAENGLKGK